MTVGFNEGIDDSAAGAIAGGDEDILAVGEIEAGKRDEATKVVKAIGVKLVGLSILFSDLVDELGIDVVDLGETGGTVLLIFGVGVVDGARSLQGP